MISADLNTMVQIKHIPVSVLNGVFTTLRLQLAFSHRFLSQCYSSTCRLVDVHGPGAFNATILEEEKFNRFVLVHNYLMTFNNISNTVFSFIDTVANKTPFANRI